MPHYRAINAATIRRITRTPRPLLTPLMLAALGLAGTARAQDAAPSTKELIDRIERLEASNRALAGEVQTLRAADGAAWLTEERAAEIRSLVADVLADSATRDSLQGAMSTAGWDNGFYLQSADGRFRLEVGGMMQFRFAMSYVPNGDSGINAGTGSGLTAVDDNVETRSGFDLPSTQLDLKGHVFGETWQYKFKAAFSNADEAMIGDSPLVNLGSGSGSFRLLDAYMRAELDDSFSVKFGQFKLPFSREQLVENEYQLAASRSTISEHLGVGRSQGIEFDWNSDNARAMFAYSNGGTDNLYGVLQAAGTDPMNSVYWTDSCDWAFTGRFEWKLAGRWDQFKSMTSPPGDEMAVLVGVAGHAQEGDPETGNQPNSNDANTWYGMTADVTAMYGGATLFASMYYHSTDSRSAFVEGANNFGVPTLFDIGGTHVYGFTVQGSYYVAPKWEVFGRYEYGMATINGIDTIDDPAGTSTLDNGNPFSVITMGVNWYIDGEDLKWTSDVGFALDAVDGVWWNPQAAWRASADQGEVVFRTQLQMAF